MMWGIIKEKHSRRTERRRQLDGSSFKVQTGSTLKLHGKKTTVLGKRKGTGRSDSYKK